VILTTWTTTDATPSAAKSKSPMTPPRDTTHTDPPTHATSPWRSSAPHRYHRYRSDAVQVLLASEDSRMASYA
jgi:hypothetical protein